MLTPYYDHNSSRFLHLVIAYHLCCFIGVARHCCLGMKTFQVVRDSTFLLCLRWNDSSYASCYVRVHFKAKVRLTGFAL